MDEDFLSLEEEGGGPENYMVSLTDLMTGVVFLFVILLASYILMAQVSRKELEIEKAANESRKIELEQQRVEFERQHIELESQRVAHKSKEQELDVERKRSQEQAQRIDALSKLLRDRENTRREMLSDVVQRLARKGVMVKLDGDNGIIRLPEGMLFDSGKALLREDGRRSLETVGVELISAIDNWCSPDSQFRLESLFIEGHTDNIPIRNADFSNNWDLSTARAVTTTLAIIDAAPRLTELVNPKGSPLLGVSGYGENRPVAPNEVESQRRLNRRIDIRFIVAYPTEEQLNAVQEILGQPLRQAE
jgi:chemotaxis protein MotB